MRNKHTTLHFDTQKGPVSVTKLHTEAGLLLRLKFPEAIALQDLPQDLNLNSHNLQVRWILLH